MAAPEMFLYIWEDVLNDWTPGLMIAVAPNVEEARAVLRAQCPVATEEDLMQTPQELNLNKPRAAYCSGGG